MATCSGDDSYCSQWMQHKTFTDQQAALLAFCFCHTSDIVHTIETTNFQTASLLDCSGLQQTLYVPSCFIQFCMTGCTVTEACETHTCDQGSSPDSSPQAGSASTDTIQRDQPQLASP